MNEKEVSWNELIGGTVVLFLVFSLAIWLFISIVYHPLKYDMVADGYQKRAIKENMGSYDINANFYWNDPKLEKVMNPSTTYVKWVLEVSEAELKSNSDITRGRHGYYVPVKIED